MNKKLNIAVFSDSFYPIIGGRENVVDNLMIELSQNHNAILIAPNIKRNKKTFDDTKLP